MTPGLVFNLDLLALALIMVLVGLGLWALIPAGVAVAHSIWAATGA